MTDKNKLSRLEIMENIKDYSYDELSDLMDEGIISMYDVYMGTIMEKIWNTDYEEWPRA